jgi:hypothetical protein
MLINVSQYTFVGLFIDIAIQSKKITNVYSEIRNIQMFHYQFGIISDTF